MKNLQVFGLITVVATILSFTVILLDDSKENSGNGKTSSPVQSPELVLNEDQRQQIQSIKQQSAEKMDTLLLQLYLVKQEQEEQLLKILTPEQRETYLQRKHQKGQKYNYNL